MLTSAAADATSVKIALCRGALTSRACVRLQVTGTSMVPALWPGDSVDVRCWKLAELNVGEVVVFEREGRLVVHRIAAVVEHGGALTLSTRGDAQENEDRPVGPSELVGIVSAVHRAGSSRRPRRRRNVAAHGLSWLVRRSPWARRLSLRLYLLGTAAVIAIRGTPTAR